MKKKGLAKVKELFWYSDSEPNEVLIAFCHLICLPLALLAEFDQPSLMFVLGGMGAGAFQLWAVIWKGCLKYRLIAVQLATAVAVITVENLYMEGLLVGSRTGWVIILAFAAWNTVRVFKEKLDKNAK
jgi:hypothetical protein